MAMKVKYKRFNGEAFARFPIPEKSKKAAQTSAAKMRKHGYKIRIVLEGGRYYIYGRPK